MREDLLLVVFANFMTHEAGKGVNVEIGGGPSHGRKTQERHTFCPVSSYHNMASRRGESDPSFEDLTSEFSLYSLLSYKQSMDLCFS